MTDLNELMGSPFVRVKVSSARTGKAVGDAVALPASSLQHPPLSCTAEVVILALKVPLTYIK